MRVSNQSTLLGLQRALLENSRFVWRRVNKVNIIANELVRKLD